MDIKDLFAKKRRLEEQSREILARESYNKEDDAQVEKLLVEASEIEARIEKMKKLEERDAEQAKIDAEKKKTEKEEKTDHKEKLRRYMLYGEGGNLGWEAGVEGRSAATAQTVTTTGGGYTVPTETKARITTAMKETGGMYANSTILKTSSGNPINWPTLDDTAVSSELLAINTDNSTLTNTNFTFGQFSLSAFKYSSGQILIPFELLEDTNIDIDALIEDQLQRRLFRGLNALWTTGGGTTTITGVVTSATDSAITGTDGTSVSRDNLVDLLHSVDPYYRRNAKFMFNDSTLRAIKKLSFGTSDDRPLWQAGDITRGEPALLEGFQYIVNQDMATMAADAKPIVFGDFSRYYIREIGEWRMKRLTELYAMVDQISFVIFVRYDGKLDTTGTPMKYLLNAHTT